MFKVWHYAVLSVLPERQSVVQLASHQYPTLNFWWQILSFNTANHLHGIQHILSLRISTIFQP